MSKVLIVTEGTRPDSQIINKINTLMLFGKLEFVFHYGTNIYQLYEDMVKDDALELPGAIIEKMEQRGDYDFDELKNNDFAEIFLFFDFDCHDEQFTKEKFEKILNFFDNETEKGKMYISYPMVEAFKHINEDNVNVYISRKVKLDDLSNYKNIVSTETRYCNIGHIESNDLKNIVLFNIEKLFALAKCSAFSYEKYKKLSEQKSVFKYQKKFLKDNEVTVLSTLTFFPIDYLGSKLFDEIVSFE